MQITAAQIALLIDARIEGDPSVEVKDVAKIEEGQKGALSFIANPKYEHYLYESQSSVIIINEKLQLERPVSATLLRVPDPYLAFAGLLEFYHKTVQGQNEKKGIEAPAFVDPDAKLGNEVYIGAFSYIGAGAEIGDGTKIYPGSFVGAKTKIGTKCILHAGVKIYDNCIIEDNVIIHSGTVIGADGFGYAPQSDASFKKVPQMGRVHIEKDVEIGANTCIDRATMGTTLIRAGSKLDNLVQVAHNVEIGAHTAIAAQSGISGSTKIGDHCIIGGQVGIVGHLSLANKTSVNAQSGVSKSVKKEGTKLNGSPAFDYKSSLKSQAIFRNLPLLLNKIQELEEKVNRLEGK